MTSDRLKSLVKLRLVLSVIALLLAGTMVFSGVMHFVTGGKAPAEEPDQPASQETAATESNVPDTQATEAATEEWVEETEGKLGTQETEPKGSVPGQPGGNGTPANPEDAEEPTPDVEEVPPEQESTKPTFPTEPSTQTTEVPEENTNAPEQNDTPPVVVNPPVPESEITEPQVTEKEPSDNGKELSAAGEVRQSLSDSKEAQPKSFPWGTLCLVSTGLLAADLAAILILSDQIRKEKERLRRAGAKASAVPVTEPKTHRIRPVAARPVLPAVPAVGTIHQVGARDYQQDSLGHAQVLGDKGILAVVADGMGGLSGGEKVSQRIVVNALNMGSQLKAGQTNGILWKMVNQINEDVNRLLGPEGLYKSGSTLVAVLACGGQFQWISVGDSRIYLYRQGYANQLNQDHDQLQAWMADVLEGRRSMDEVLRHPDGRKLTSFIGMGQLKHIDGSLNPIALEPGDRLVLMSDGVYSVVNEERLAAVLKRCPDVNQAASAMDRMIREAKNPHQDNYTAIILGF